MKFSNAQLTAADNQRRFFPVETEFSFDTEKRGDQDQPKISGLAIPYNKLSVPIMGLFRERFRPGSLTKTLKENPDIRCLWQHDESRVLGRTKNGTLELTDTPEGLRFSALPPDTSWAKDALITMRRGDVDQMSFRFKVPKGKDTFTQEGSDVVRDVNEAFLREISPVTFPGYPDSSVSVRSILSEAGIDETFLAGIMQKKTAGQPITDEEKRTISSIVDTLKALTEPDQVVHSDESRQAGLLELEHMKMQLELAAAES